MAPRGAIDPSVVRDASTPLRDRARDGDAKSASPPAYLPAALRCQRVALSIFLCFFLRMRLRRFLISEPMRLERLLKNRA